MKSKLPPSQLIEVLKRKSEARTDVEFDYIAELENLRKRIGGEVRFINQLFPEYTPHDEEYHLSRLFHVADTLIEFKRYECMNASELFVLACGLYGHDWGMAVSDSERDYVVSGQLPHGFAASDFALLHDEHNAFKRFAKDAGLDVAQIEKEGVPVDAWREYVRKTHAFRSGARLRDHFQKIGEGVGEAAARVAEAHWFNIEDLEDPRHFPTNFSVLHENVDLPAIAVYVRLVDLLDIGHDRTPYVIWKFVAPRNAYSKMEWAKHRALQPITCPTYLKGRVVVVDGSTDDHEVFAALEDLHNYCDKQLRECMNLLSRLADERDLLDLYHIEWRVVANGFDPVLVRFEFDRDKVFEILSNEIYQGDAYVFLRELLQNSIDAIRTRRELLERAGIVPQSFGLIRVNVEHFTGGDIIITWTDDGIGIDEHVLRNYLAVAGRSYYQSKDFQREGLTFDPISRFGIGILSCFMAGDVLEIETQKDPYASFASTTPLKVRIPSVTGQFRVEKTLQHEFGIGTRVRVYVDGAKLPDGFDRLDVTRYLRIVGAFSEFPIVIFEGGKTSVVLHPESALEPNTDVRFADYQNIEVYKIDLRYPFDEAVLPQDSETAQRELVEYAFDLSKDLAVDSCEGRISYLGIRDEQTFVSRSRQGEGVVVYSLDGENKGEIRWQPGWDELSYAEPDEWVKSATPKPTYAVYRDGILVPGAELSEGGSYLRARLPKRKAVINVRQGSPELSVSRTNMRTSRDGWSQYKEVALQKFLAKKLLEELENSEGISKFARFGTFAATFHLDESFLKFSDFPDFPVPMLENGSLTFKPWAALRDNSIKLLPNALDWGVESILRDAHGGKPYKGVFRWWRGSAVICEGSGDTLTFDYGLWLLRLLIEHTHVLSSAVFVTPPHPSLPELVQEVWEPRTPEGKPDLIVIANEGLQNPVAVRAQHREFLLKNMEGARYQRFERFVEFPDSARPPLKVGDRDYNLGHPVAELLFRCLCWRVIAKEDPSADKALIGRVEDATDVFYRWDLRARIKPTVAKLIEVALGLGLVSGDTGRYAAEPSDLWYQSGDHSNLVKLASDCNAEFGSLH